MASSTGINNTTSSARTTRSLSTINFPLTFQNMEASLKKGNRETVKVMAMTLGCTIAMLRKALIEHYGSRIVFTKGRTGGIKVN